MEQIEYEKTFEEDKTEKIFEQYIRDSYNLQRHPWIDKILMLVIAIILGVSTQSFVCPLIIIIYMRLYSLWSVLYHRQTRIAKYLVYLKNRINK
jgi:hypothetical protein